MFATEGILVFCLVCGTKCHPTSAPLESAVQSCPSGEVYTGCCLSKSAEMEPIGIPSLRWEDNSKMDIQEVAYECMDWIELAQLPPRPQQRERS
jgi:hypothetical protein